MAGHCLPWCPTSPMARAPACPQPQLRAQGQRDTSACVAVTVSGGMKGLGGAQVPAAPEEHIHVLCLETALLATGSSRDLAFHPFLGPGGAEGELGHTGSCHWALAGLAA